MTLYDALPAGWVWTTLGFVACDSAVLPSPDVLAAEIMEDLRAALAQFSLILGEPGDAILD